MPKLAWREFKVATLAVYAGITQFYKISKHKYKRMQGKLKIIRKQAVFYEGS